MTLIPMRKEFTYFSLVFQKGDINKQEMPQQAVSHKGQQMIHWLTLCILMDFPIHIDAISMELPILYV